MPIEDFKFDGGRYTGERGMPLTSIDELRRLQAVISSVARHLFLEDHPERSRVSKSFRDAVTLRLQSVREGSVVPAMTVGPADTLDVGDDPSGYFERSFEQIVRALEALENGRSLPTAFPDDAVSDLLQLGKSFRDDERLLVRARPNEETWVKYDRDSRRALQRRARVSFVESEESLLGYVRGLVLPSLGRQEAELTFATSAGQTLRGTTAVSWWDELYPFLSKDDTDRAPLVSLAAVLLETDDGIYSEIKDILAIEPALPADWSKRLDDIAQLTAGWLDGIGEAISDLSVRNAEQWLLAILDREWPRPGIFPTPDGDIRLEWEFAAGGLHVDVGVNAVSLSWLPDDSDEEHVGNYEGTPDPDLLDWIEVRRD
jgi:hypothetical protein